MRAIDIQISQAKIKSFNIELGETNAEVSVSIGLLGPGGKEISTFNLGSGTWRDSHFSIQPAMMNAILSMATELEEIVTKECTKTLNMIETKSQEPAMPF